MIDASKDYMKDGNKNRLREQDIRKIVDVFNNQLKFPSTQEWYITTKSRRMNII